MLLFFPYSIKSYRNAQVTGGPFWLVTLVNFRYPKSESKDAKKL